MGPNLGLVTHSCNPRSGELGLEGSGVQDLDQDQLKLCETLSQSQNQARQTKQTVKTKKRGRIGTNPASLT